MSEYLTPWSLFGHLWKGDNCHLICGLWGLKGIIHVKHLLARAWNMVEAQPLLVFPPPHHAGLPWIGMKLSWQDKLAQQSLILWLPCSRYCDCAGNATPCPQGAYLPNVCHLWLPLSNQAAGYLENSPVLTSSGEVNSMHSADGARRRKTLWEQKG